MRISHSKLNTILTCPMSYYLNYVQGISLKEKPTALSIGSAVHHGLEVGTADLDKYFKENGTFEQKTSYSQEQLLAECMLYGYFKHKDEIYDKILTYDDEKLELIKEEHEFELYAPLPSKKGFSNEFYGIIDLLLLTNKGFIILDYKTSSNEPNWDDYLEQIYRYVFLIKSNFPDVPILKIGIINLRKTQIRQKKSENEVEYRNRLKFEYEINDEKYINYHEFLRADLDEELLNLYINNLYNMCDAASITEQMKNWYINYTAANGQYKSQYWNMFYKVPGAEAAYQIKDIIVDNLTGEIKEGVRDCNEVDMRAIEVSQNDLLNHFKQYALVRVLNPKENSSFKKFKDNLKNSKYVFDEGLIDNYEEIFKKINKDPKLKETLNLSF